MSGDMVIFFKCQKFIGWKSFNLVKHIRTRRIFMVEKYEDISQLGAAKIIMFDGALLNQ